MPEYSNFENRYVKEPKFDTFDLLVFKVTLVSFGALVSKLPVIRETDVLREKNKRPMGLGALLSNQLGNGPKFQK